MEDRASNIVEVNTRLQYLMDKTKAISIERLCLKEGNSGVRPGPGIVYGYKKGDDKILGCTRIVLPRLTGSEPREATEV